MYVDQPKASRDMKRLLRCVRVIDHPPERSTWTLNISALQELLPDQIDALQNLAEVLAKTSQPDAASIASPPSHDAAPCHPQYTIR